ncbi:MAG TPA: hypothetical protein VGP38_01805 [Rubrobacter sp.]|nr:hypothetical protein [Rubrobacter sp.]
MSRSLARRGRRRSGRIRGNLLRFVPFGSMAGFGVMAAAEGVYPLAVMLGMGAIFTGRRLFDRRRNARKELRRRVRANVAELMRVGRTDGIAAPQMKRLVGLQEGLLESWELLPEEYGPLLLEDLYTVVDEVEASALLARRRSALRRHLESVDRRGIVARIQDLEGELRGLEEGSAIRVSFEAALEGRRGELAAHDQVPRAIGMINAQLEGVESLLGNLRGELLALDASPGALSPESGLVSLKQRVAYFRRSLEEVQKSVDRLPGALISDEPSDGFTETFPERIPVR